MRSKWWHRTGRKISPLCFWKLRRVKGWSTRAHKCADTALAAIKAEWVSAVSYTTWPHSYSIMGVPQECINIRKCLIWHVISHNFYKVIQNNPYISFFSFIRLTEASPQWRGVFSHYLLQSNCSVLCDFANGSSNAMLTFTHEKTSDLGASQLLRLFTSTQSLTSFHVPQLYMQRYSILSGR